jgi:hypothetical protein
VLSPKGHADFAEAVLTVIFDPDGAGPDSVSIAAARNKWQTGVGALAAFRHCRREGIFCGDSRARKCFHAFLIPEDASEYRMELRVHRSRLSEPSGR